MAFRPDGRALALGGVDSALIDLATGGVIDRPFGPSLDGAQSLAFSSDSGIIATGFRDRGVDLWDVRTRRAIGRLAPEQGVFDNVVALAFSPDGRLVATGGSSGDVRIWETATRVPLGRPYTAHSGPVLALAFSGDGSSLHSVGGDGTLQRYAVDPGGAATDVCGRAGTSLPEDDWRLLIPEAPYRKVC
jgi:WD40 repeat protein